MAFLQANLEIKSIWRCNICNKLNGNVYTFRDKETIEIVSKFNPEQYYKVRIPALNKKTTTIVADVLTITEDEADHTDLM
jgi:hypothetical protein